jgi:Carbohydrate family 9 binding domain-like/Fibronectin type III domain
MRSSHLALGPLLAGCVLVAVMSCSTDETQTEAGLGPTVSPAVAAVSAYDIVKVPSITVDGSLDDWANIAAISMADNSGRPGGVDNTAKVKLAWDDTYLYAAYDVTDSELLGLQTTRDHPDVYKDDAVELFIDPEGDGTSATSMTTTDYQFVANVLETLDDKRGNGTGGKDPSYNAASFLAQAVINGTLNASGTDVGYAVELRIAWTDLGITPSTGHLMRMDLAVDDRDGAAAQQEYFDWANLGTNFNNPSGWKEVALVNRPPPTSAYNIIKVGTTALTVDGNLGDWAGVAAISMADSSGRPAGADNTAKVKLAWDNTYLYAAYDVTDTDLRALQTTRDHGEIYKDDAIELYLDPQGDGWTAPKMTQTDYQLLANIREAVGDMKGNGMGGKDASYNAGSLFSQTVMNGTLNATGTDVRYTLELRIAWTDLGVTPAAGHFMRVDPAVDDRDGDPPAGTEEFDWAGLTLYNSPVAWKDVQLIVDATAPTAPTNPVLTVVSSSQITVSWTASTSVDVAKYRIYRGTNGATPTLLTTDSGSPYQDTGLTAGTSYTYQLSAVDAAGNESAKTSPVSATTTPPPSTPPGGTIGVAPRNGPLIDIDNNPHYTAQFDGHNAFDPGTRVEAGLGSSRSVFDGNADYPFTAMGNGDDWSFRGGLVIGQKPDDGSLPWSDDVDPEGWHGAGPGLALAAGKRILVDHFSARNKADGISVGAGHAVRTLGNRDGTVIRGAVLEDMHDDGIENDLKDEITVYGGFISTMAGISTRPLRGHVSESSPDWANRTMTVDGTIIWLKPKRFTDSGHGSTPVVFRFWKWQVVNPQYAMNLRLRNAVLRYDGNPFHAAGGNSNAWGSMPVSRLIEQSNITVVFPYNTSLPSGWPTSGLSGFTYYFNVPGTVNGVATSSMARTKWNQVVAAQRAADPQLVINDPGLFGGF